MGGAGIAGIEIRPRSVPELLDGALRLYLARFAPMFLIALVAGLVSWLTVLAGHPLTVSSSVYIPPFVRNMVGMAGGRQAAWWGQLVSLLAALLGQCALIQVANAALTAADGLPSAGTVLAQAFRRIWPLFVVVLAIGLVAGVGAVFVLVPTVLFGTWWVVAPVVTVVESHPASRSLGRSRALVGGAFWHTLWAIVLGFLAAGIISSVLAAGSVVVALPGSAGRFLPGLWSTAATDLVSPYLVCLLILLYYDLRARKEGLDLLPAGGLGVGG